MDLAENRFGKTWKHFLEVLKVDHICLGLFNAIAPSGHPGTHTTKSGMLIAANIG